jgi:hypothetical protein
MRRAETGESMFFSDEKNQKTFMSSAAPTSPAMAWICSLAPNQKSFGSFLQKRTDSLGFS